MMFRLRCIGFIFLIATVPLLGCPDNKGENMFNIEEKIKDIEEKMKEKMLVGRLDAVLLTVDDLPTMELDGGMARRIDGIAKQPPVVDRFHQSWDGTQPEEHIYVRYWLFQSVADTQKAANHWYQFLGPQAFYQPEPNAADVIGDATWRIPDASSLWFVKNNVLVYIMDSSLLHNQLTLTRSVARKVEAKIAAASEKQ